MKFKFEQFPKNYLYKLLGEIIKNNNILTFETLKKELLNYKHNDVDSINYNISIKEHDNLCLFYTPSVFYNFHSTNELIDNMIHQLDVCIVDKETLLPIVYKIKNINYDTNSEQNNSHVEQLQQLDYLSNNVKIYNNYSGEYIVLFNNNDKWLILHNNDIIDIQSDNSIVVILFNNLLQDKNINLQYFDKNNTYHFLLIHYRLNKCIIYPQWGNEFKELVFIKSEQKYTLRDTKIDNIFNNLIKNDRIYLSCWDELVMYLENLNYSNMINKRLSNKGLFMSFIYETNQQININFNTKLYNKIHSYFVSNKNIHQIHLKLYQLNKCNEILPYITNNYIDIVRRINLSIKTLSREMLNIYFLTRNKQNEKLYEVLPKSYKNILFNMHKIFMKKKNDCCETELVEKKSVTINNVYNYLKNMSNNELIKLYKERQCILKITLDKDIDDTIMIENCISTIMQTKLMDC